MRAHSHAFLCRVSSFLTVSSVQVQGLIYVHVPVRMSVVRLDDGGLFVYAPIAPTAECLTLLSELEAEAGPVRHILLPTLALEHKLFAAPFARARPDAQLWLASAQYSFPIDVPLWALGFPRGARRLPSEAAGEDGGGAVPWAAQLPYRTLGPLRDKVGAFEEVVVFDRASRSLLVTDCIVSLPLEPPEVIRANDERALIFHGRDAPADEPSATDAALAVGWQRICLFALYFQCSALNVTSPPDGTLVGAIRFFREAFPSEVPKRARQLGWKGFIAWSWRPSWRRCFDALRSGGRPLVPPILQVAILNRQPDDVLAFARAVASDFDFTRIVPCHFDAPVAAGPREWLDAFEAFLLPPDPRRRIMESVGGVRGELPSADLLFLREAEQGLVQSGSVRPAAPGLTSASLPSDLESQ